jgi:hypothetical protein
LSSLLKFAVRAIIQTQWLAYGRRLVVEEVILHLLLMVLFATYCVLLPELIEAFSTYHQTALAAETRPQWKSGAVMAALVALSSACVLVVR